MPVLFRRKCLYESLASGSVYMTYFCAFLSGRGNVHQKKAVQSTCTKSLDGIDYDDYDEWCDSQDAAPTPATVGDPGFSTKSFAANRRFKGGDKGHSMAAVRQNTRVRDTSLGHVGHGNLRGFQREEDACQGNSDGAFVTDVDDLDEEDAKQKDHCVNRGRASNTKKRASSDVSSGAHVAAGREKRLIKRLLQDMGFDDEQVSAAVAETSGMSFEAAVKFVLDDSVRVLRSLG
jgi:hypothetical protein